MSIHSRPKSPLDSLPPRSRAGALRRAAFMVPAIAVLTAAIGVMPAAASTVGHPALRGSLDLVSSSVGHIRVAGWSVDPVAYKRSNSEDIVVDGAMASLPVATQARPDVNRVLRITGSHGFGVTVPAVAGLHRVCVITRPIPNTGGHDSLLGCRIVRVS